MDYIEGIQREQIHLFTESLDRIIDEENPVRFIDAYVEKLDLKKLGFKTPKLITGRPPFRPELLLKIYIYSYLKKIRSSRKIEDTCNTNIEMMWLTNKLSPDFKTIADFRKDNKAGIKNLFKEFLKLCNKLELLSFKCVAVDGTKLRAQNSFNSVYKRDEIAKTEAAIEEKINQYIADLDNNDEKEKDELEFLSKNISKKLSKLKKSKEKITAIKQIFEDNPELEVYFSNDPDCKFQKDNGRTNPGYNCQSAVDEKNNLIVANDVTNENNDQHQLTHMKDQVKEIVADLSNSSNVSEEDNRPIIVADAGYYTEEEILSVVGDAAVDVYVPNPRDVKTSERTGKNKKNKVPTKDYQQENFTYNKESDCYICPQGKMLNKLGNTRMKKGQARNEYFCSECGDCIVKTLCTKSSKGRRLDVSANIEEMSIFRSKVKSELGAKIVSKRKELVEHPFGTIKHTWGFRYFMQTGKEKVQSEFSFISFIYNFRRVLNIMPINKLIEAIN